MLEKKIIPIFHLFIIPGKEADSGYFRTTKNYR